MSKTGTKLSQVCMVNAGFSQLCESRLSSLFILVNIILDKFIIQLSLVFCFINLDKN